VRELHYVKDRKFAKFVQQQLDPTMHDQVFVYLPDLTFAFSNAVELFKVDVKANATLQAIVFTHAAKLIIHERKKVT
jgi:hypothetical protein